MCQPRGDPKCLYRERSQKPPICPFNRQTPQQRAEEGRRGSSQPLPSTASGHRQAWALSKLRCPKHLPSCPARCAAGHLGTASPHSAAKRRTRNRFSYLVAAASSCHCPSFCCCCRGEMAELLVPLRWLSLFLSLDRWGALGVPPSSGGGAPSSAPQAIISVCSSRLQFALCLFPSSSHL